VLKRLRERGVEARAAFHSPEKPAPARKQGLGTVVLDYAERASIAAGIRGWCADALLDLYQSYVAGGAQRVTKDVERVTGGKARSFDEFAGDYAAGCR
jgi:hypothetical protein